VRKFIFSSLLLGTFALEAQTVNITASIASVDTTHAGKKVTIQRIQDTNNRLVDDYSKTSRECPPYCIQPMKVDAGIKTVGVVEVVTFIKNKVNTNSGVLIDTRLKNFYELETIPSARNIPFSVLQGLTPAQAKMLFEALGAKTLANGKFDFTNAKELLIFCNGAWCEQTKRFVTALNKYNYPKNKISYYRDGFQDWKLHGLTTIINKEIKK